MNSKLPINHSIRITEVGPRDGLQNQPKLIETVDKVAFINALSLCGFAEIEVSSFVSPKWVPQLADSAEVFTQITRNPDIIYSALVPNERGLEIALEANVEKVSVFTAASETFNKRNINATIDESIERFKPVVEGSKSAGKPVRGYISCVVACPYEGYIDPDAVALVVKKLQDLGIDEIDLGETIGVAVPTDIHKLYDAVGEVVKPGDTTLHLHDTRGTGLACLLAAIDIGVYSFDASAGGLGGCPYAPGATGNIATEDVIYCLAHMGIETGVDLEKLLAAGKMIEAVLGYKLPSRVFRALTAV